MTGARIDLPTDATAIFAPDQVPALPTSDYTHASVHYLNRDAYEVNILGRAGSSRRPSEIGTATSFASSAPAIARRRCRRVVLGGAFGEIDTQRIYEDNGLNLVDELGPLHNVLVDSGEFVAARRHTVTRYDETKPAGDTTKYHLPTTRIVSAQWAGNEIDARKTDTAYDWSLRYRIL